MARQIWTSGFDGVVEQREADGVLRPFVVKAALHAGHVEHECTCLPPPNTNGPEPDCPVHGIQDDEPDDDQLDYIGL